jgi:hypothetical protein
MNDIFKSTYTFDLTSKKNLHSHIIKIHYEIEKGTSLCGVLYLCGVFLSLSLKLSARNVSNGAS